jgi:hypothetical protein
MLPTRVLYDDRDGGITLQARAAAGPQRLRR